MSMNLRPPSFRSLAAASSAAMYSRPHFRGARPTGRRTYSDRPSGPAGGDHAESVSGDNHFSAVSETNRGFRHSYNAVPPPPQYAAAQRFHGPGPQSNQTYAPVFQQRPGAQGPYRHPRPMSPAFSNHHQFTPQQGPQQYRPRPSRPPDYRDWEYRKRGLPSHSGRFTVLSYNILADYLANEHYHKLYFHIPRYIMDWNWRKKNICFEFGLWSADILCLQEVDRFQDIEAELRNRGYAGIWKMRTGDPADGCAIFWRFLRFKLLHEESIEYIKLGLRDNVAQICVFESLSGQNNISATPTLSASGSSASPNRVVICNIHVLFNPKRGDVKLGQMRVLLERAHAVSKLWGDAPIVICGDFNCTPKSPLYNFISEQKLDISNLPRDQVSGQAMAEIRPQRPPPDFRTQAADIASSQASVVNSANIEQRDLPIDAQNSASPQNFANASSTRMPENHSSDITNTSDPTSTSNSNVSQLDGPSEVISPDSLDHTPSNQEVANESPDKISPDSLDHAPSNQEVALSASCEPTGADLLLDEKLDLLSLNVSVDGAMDKPGENCDSFLSELHGQRDSRSLEDQVLDGNLQVEHEIMADVWNSSSAYSSAWTPAEIQTATGSADDMVVEHPLKLMSAYAEVENSSGLRDSSGEPFITSHHRRFSGTVDYIWHTEGLQTLKILAPIPKHVLQQTRGYPTKKWGSDHLALVSEFAFTKDIMSSENSGQ
ncbi:Carbon catabolite repressor protein 4 homolog 6 [Striga hermonthica]|uniref:Carbon catabolite repressor protein 4 homolog 6 n=1 Tax=Striga hermonthica TaxID=68872 RepID=A0A9N7MM37_STRHE|nr:Carbon catabolite repressor protein 4 homolog 6 [Striga hermonthica]